MPSKDTVLMQITNTAGGGAPVVAPGDSLTIRSGGGGGNVFLDDITIKGGQSVTAVVTSPFLHDTTHGITIKSAQAPTLRTLPRQVSQPLSPQDTLLVNLNSGGANSSLLALHTYYTDLGASNARLYMPGDVVGLITQIKPMEVDCVASPTIGAWNDTLFNTFESVLKANQDYAILGYTVDVACGVIGIKGQDTGGLRIGAPGTTLQDVSAEYFLELSLQTGRPHVPVFNAANVNNMSVSVADNAASTAVKVQLILGLLSHTLN